MTTISAKGFAEFVLAGPGRRATIVRNMLRPKSPESQIVVRYYAPAIGVIRVYHAKGNDRTYLAQELKKMEERLDQELSAQAKAKIRNNIRAVRAYVEIYGTRKRKVIPRPRLYYTSGRIRLSASPDMAIEEDGRVKLVKLGVKKRGDKPELIRVLLRIIYQAAESRLTIDPRDVVYFDVANGARMRGTPDDVDLTIVIDNALDAMETMF